VNVDEGLIYTNHDAGSLDNSIDFLADFYAEVLERFLVIIDEISLPGAISTITPAFTAPSSTDLTMPCKVFLALIFISNSPCLHFLTAESS
jgi:hypothetical protein